jgi:predicted phage-related endonuclease
VKVTILDCEQRSEEWYAARSGRLTGSVAGDMLAKIKTGEAAARRDLRVQLVCERLTGQPQEDGFQSKEMIRGIELEPVAFGAYEAETGIMVDRSGFIAADDLMVGCSLDGHVGTFDGIVELKCPKSATHLRYLRGGCVPSDYLPQLRHNVWVTGAQWADFVSFDDRFPEGLQLFRVRMTRAQLLIPEYEAEAMKFLAEVDAEVIAVGSLRRAA